MLLPGFLLTAVFALVVGSAGAVAWGGLKNIPLLASISNPFKDVDYSTMAKVQRYTARDGTSLAWYSYTPAPSAAATLARRVVLVHGSSARGQSMHMLHNVQAVAQACKA